MLLKQITKLQQGKNVNDFFNYMKDYEVLLASKSQASNVAEFMDPDHVQKALAVRSIYYTMKVAKMLSDSKASSKSKQNELFAIEVNRMTKLHLIYIMYETAKTKIAKGNL